MEKEFEVSCELCGPEVEGTCYDHEEGWVCQMCQDNLESDRQHAEENYYEPSEADEWASYDEWC